MKWFNASKGFGFVALADGADAYLHMRVVEAAGWPQCLRGRASQSYPRGTAKGPSGGAKL
ncbi:hypothetical protein RFM41_31315 [Mesorhizobium sp. VK25A]|uniref:Cold-shock protein n=3 Tax=Mesorhizobium TaxID=68287 RepID=A0ABU5ADY9_9HYPH|nr:MULTISPECIES: hypothetical protein [unclassified Mesorhizobium]MDX8450675.1 hypothetical protein [Mesorhizobium sp. VK3C]MDX8470054.1 hypothetical protein [Mesorhizobium sp. VK23B]MDX8476393.1 hypothetical protein [Mesorhizobium sp. VK23A]MDX8495669.1 hypothetical protein [Mesorhizobium sp. VK22B]MDX8508943.1 hypothetical protein [Mesorhizobium sp. VK22E]